MRSRPRHIGRTATRSRLAALVAAVVSLSIVAGTRAADDTRPPDASDPLPAQEASNPATSSPSETRLQELVVEAQRPVSAASSRELRAKDFAIRPHLTVTQVLNNVPGLLVAQHQGGAKAPQWFLRGFDADHGTDVAVYADDMPINLVSHAHGQGYADPNFLIPEVIDRVELYKGPYFPQFGDFATAGAVKLITKEEFKENFVKAEGGSFDTMRYVLGASPQIGNVKTLFAGQAYYTNGPFIHPENLARYNGQGRMTVEPTSDSKLSATVQGYAADWDGSGQIPGAARVDRHARPLRLHRPDRGRPHRPREPAPRLALHANPVRHLGGARLCAALQAAPVVRLHLLRQQRVCGSCSIRTAGSRTPATARCSRTRSTSPATRSTRAIRASCSADARSYTRNWFLAEHPAAEQLALETRTDDVHIKLQRAVRRTSFFTVNDVYIQEHSFSGYWAQQIFFTDWLRFEGGLRGDFYIFDVNNRLPSRAPIRTSDRCT